MKNLNPAQVEKKAIFDRIRHGEPPRASYLGGHSPCKGDIHDTSYFLEPKRLRSIFRLSE